ncbi:Rho GTPase-activating protein 29 [Zostera marina]|uniref:Rho GTPase-activating protein 29 n=1 Tax=Zostera marina TaxID=29655 RepID=A0A0K9NZQ8_ZOSMR|nr:Rho GTPase-activating protein 29 [Zostera marina]
MSSTTSPRWHEKATGFFSNSGTKIKQVGQSAGTLLGDVAKGTGGNVSDAAGRVSSLVKNRWEVLQKSKSQQSRSSSGDSVQERFISAAASTGTVLKRSFTETKDRVIVGKMKVEEVAKKTADKTKIILNNLERWQKGVADNDVFGVSIEIVIQRQNSSKPVPEILVKCAEFLVLSGLHTEHLFKMEGDTQTIRQLISLYNNDCNACLPDGLQPIEVAALIKYYLASLPEPLTTFALYLEIRDARSSIDDLRNILKRLPNVNYMTLEFVTALLLCVSKRSSLNKMNAHSLSLEFAPLLIWQKGDPRTNSRNSYSKKTEGDSKSMEFAASRTAVDNLSDDEDNVYASSLIPLDDGVPADYGAIEVIQCLIEHHNAIFTDANETTWK